MAMIKMVFGYVHIVLGLAVALQFLASDMYSGDASGDVWDILNYFMAVGAVAALVFSYLRVRDADNSDVKEWVASSAMLIASAALFLMFFEQWFAWTVFTDADAEPWNDDFRSMVWIIVDVSFPIVNIIVGRYLLRSANS